ncbi:MAG: GNAT family N-acetyltransferase [Alphaproteobacteria bacterium]|nr:GNAT family N-acetyltransferase [Alphaproteobacteria bacterium]
MIPVGCHERPFDASILGRQVWSLEDITQAAEVVDAARQLDVGLVFWRGEVDKGLVLESHGFRKIETLLTLRCALPQEKRALPPGIGIAQVADADMIADLAAEAFRSDRWHTDPEIPNDRADAYKAAWAHNNIMGRAGVTLITLTGAGEVTGFNSMLFRDDALIIDLIAVAPSHQGQGLAGRLINAAKADGAGRFKTLSAGTQASNAASLRLYDRHDMKESMRADTWHWTP